VFVAALTTFYMFRLLFVAFLGEPRAHESEHASESPRIMIWPLRILALASIAGGVIGISQLFDSQFTGEARHAEHTDLLARIIEPFQHAPVATFFGLAAVAVGFLAAKALYAKAASDPLPARITELSAVLRSRFYFDELYEATLIRAHDLIASVSDWIDRWIVDGFCIGLVRGGTDFTGRALRLFQTGNLQTYAFLFVLGVAVVLWFVLGK